MSSNNPLVNDAEMMNALEAMQEIDKLGSDDCPKITEEVFIRVLLPVLTKTDGQANLDVWYQIAGHPLREIDVTDAKGKVLFRIPSLMNKGTQLYRGSNKYDNVFEVFATAIKKDNVLPNLGAKYIEQNLINNLKKSKVNIEDARRWNAILRRYNIVPKINIPGEEKIEPAKAKVEEPIFSDEYEDM